MGVIMKAKDYTKLLNQVEQFRQNVRLKGKDLGFDEKALVEIEKHTQFFAMQVRSVRHAKEYQE